MSPIVLAVVMAAFAFAFPARAQDALLPQFSLDAAGSCRQLTVRDRRANTNVLIGCVRPGGNGFRLSPSDLSMTALSPMNLDFAARRPEGHNPPNAVLLGIGNRLAFCPALSCRESASTDHQRASLLVAAESQVDGQAEEQTLAVTTAIKTGLAKKWAPSTAFAVGDNVEFPDSRNAVYRAVQAGTSAASGTGPSGTGNSIVDGTVRWQWINDAAINAKVGIYNEVLATTGGGKGWAQANNFEMRPGYLPSFAVNTELDFTNNTGIDCVPGTVAGCNNLYLRTYGTNASTSSINVEGPDTGKAAAYFGLYLHGRYLSSDASVQVDTSGAYGLRFGGFGSAGYSGAAIADSSTSSNGILLSGTYVTAQIAGAGWSVNPAGGISATGLDLPSGSVFERSPYVPTAPNSPCITGQRSWDASFEYRCVATNTWKRAALSSW